MFDDVLQVSNVKVAEHLAQGLQECSRLQEIIQCSGISGSDSTNTVVHEFELELEQLRSKVCLLYTSPSPRDRQKSRMPSSA